MTFGNDVATKIARGLPPSPWSMKLLCGAAAMLVLGMALGLPGLAIRLVAFPRSFPLSSIPVTLNFGNPFLKSFLFGAAGLLVFFLLQTFLGLVRMAIYGTPEVTLPKQQPPAPVEEQNAVPPQQPQSPNADLQHASPRDSRFRTRAHFSQVKGQAKSYSGPYRRATDPRPDTGHTTPQHCACNQEAGTPPESDGTFRNPLIGDPLFIDRRSPSGSHPITRLHAKSPQETAEEAHQRRAIYTDTSLLNPGSGVFRHNFPPAENAVLPASTAHAPLDSSSDIPQRS